MPSTFTNNGGIELPADGEKDGVWGDVVNLNMQIVDRLTNGVGAVSLTGTTHTLTTANGVLSDGQYAIVVFGGAPSGTNTVTIAPNDADKVFFIRNATAQSVIMSQGSGGNVTIPAGAGAIVYANGAGTGAAVADLTATFIPDLSLAGITASVAELNLLDGATLSTAELNYVDGVTSAIQTQIDDKQTQIDGKQATITGAATTITSDDLAVSRALVSDGSGKVAVSAVTAAELGLLDGVTASTAELNLLDGVPLTTDLSYVDGVTSNIQTQIDNVASVPSGAVFHFAASTAPVGYLAANGSAVSRTTYAALFAVIGTTFGVGDGASTFNLPDLRGEFIRGWDDARGVDIDRVFGSAQADEFKAHTHTQIYYRGGETDSFGGSRDADSLQTTNTGSTGGNETRPRNIALLACIKV
jgi:microcystin-dependent protein